MPLSSFSNVHVIEPEKLALLAHSSPTSSLLSGSKLFPLWPYIVILLQNQVQPTFHASINDSKSTYT